MKSATTENGNFRIQCTECNEWMTSPLTMHANTSCPHCQANQTEAIKYAKFVRRLSVSGFKSIPAMSRETCAFVAKKIMLDGNVVGSAQNDGQGGMTNFYGNSMGALIKWDSKQEHYLIKWIDEIANDAEQKIVEAKQQKKIDKFINQANLRGEFVYACTKENGDKIWAAQLCLTQSKSAAMAQAKKQRPDAHSFAFPNSYID